MIKGDVDLHKDKQMLCIDCIFYKRERHNGECSFDHTSVYADQKTCYAFVYNGDD